MARTVTLRSPLFRGRSCGSFVSGFLGAAGSANGVCLPCRAVEVVNEGPAPDSTDSNPSTIQAGIQFDVAPQTVEFLVNVDGQPLNGQVSFNRTTALATFVSTSTQDGTVNATVFADRGTPCERVFTWSFTYVHVFA